MGKIKKLFLLLSLVVATCEGSINFVHIPKTGGTTIHFTLVEKFTPAQVYPHRIMGPGLYAITSKKEVEDVFHRLPAIEHDFVSGHFPIWFFKEKDPFFETSYFFTVLRDPVERVLSHDRFIVKDATSRGEILPPDPSRISSNVICKTLTSDCTLEGEELLADCIRNLERMDFIIFMDDFESGVKHLFYALGLDIPKEIPHYNTTDKKEVDQKVIEQIKIENALDIQLYEYASKNLRFKSKSY